MLSPADISALAITISKKSNNAVAFEPCNILGKTDYY